MLTIENLRSVDFARSYSWEVQFPDFPGRFFPAHTCTEPLFSMRTGSFDFGVGNFKYPEGADEVSMQIGLYEVDSWDITKWLRSWYDLVVDHSYGVALLNDAVKKLISTKLNVAKVPVLTRTLYVILDGQIDIPMGSEKGGLIDITIPVTIVGEDF